MRQGARIGKVVLPCASMGGGCEGFELRGELEKYILIVGIHWVVETVYKVPRFESFWPWEDRVELAF